MLIFLLEGPGPRRFMRIGSAQDEAYMRYVTKNGFLSQLLRSGGPGIWPLERESKEDHLAAVPDVP